MKKKFNRPNHQKSNIILQITSMADIFMILLVFLLKNFSTDASKITMHTAIALPSVKQIEPIIDHLKLEISQNSILLDDIPIIELKEFHFDPSELESDGTSRHLNIALSQQRSSHSLLKYPRLIIIADKMMPYWTLRKILASATKNNFEGFNLIVTEEQ